LPFIETYSYRGKIEIQEGFVARSTVKSNSKGVFQKVVLKSEPGALIRIGSNVGISGSTISASTKIIILNNVLIGSGCLITDSDAHPIDPIARIQNLPNATKQRPIEIEDDVFIGARSIILKGVRIGKGSIVGAGSVVSLDVPPYCIVAGNPARIIRTINVI
jgi:acetyltransferase-like isoleucine patch superfamily enzyme